LNSFSLRHIRRGKLYKYNPKQWVYTLQAFFWHNHPT
jgi:hypothetical protein